jgi:hypothetical protein
MKVIIYMKDNLSWKTILFLLTISIVLGLITGKYLAIVHIPSEPYTINGK